MPIRLTYLPDKLFPDIISGNEYHQRNKDNHSCYLGALNKLIAELFTGEGFYEQENNMPAIKSRNGKDIDKSKPHGQQAGDEPEAVPFQRAAINNSNADRSLDGLAYIFFTRKNSFEPFDIANQSLESIRASVFEGIREGIIFQRIIHAGYSNACI